MFAAPIVTSVAATPIAQAIALAIVLAMAAPAARGASAAAPAPEAPVAATPVAAAPVAAAVREYRADMHESRWLGESSPLRCELQHPIPRFGTARFFRAAGKDLQFELAAIWASQRRAPALLDSVAPAWKHPHEQRLLTRLEDSGDKLPFRLQRAAALRLLYELERGMQPTFIYPDAADGEEQLKVGLSPVNFRDALGDFRHCLEALAPFGFESIRDTRVHFETDSAELDSYSRRALERIAEYQPLDERVQRIIVHGHTDWVDSEPYNLDLSEFRAWAVVDFLVDQGVPEALVEAQFHGETSPREDNRSASGRAFNRRVTVEVVRAPERETSAESETAAAD